MARALVEKPVAALTLPRAGSATNREVPERFAEFIRLSTMFSRNLVSQLGPRLLGDASTLAERNVRVVRTVFAKWNLEILSLLYALRELGFEELRHRLTPISPRVLSRKLRTLEERHLLERQVLATPALRVRYRLTPHGLAVAKLGEPVVLYLHLTDTPPEAPPSA